MNFSLVSPFVLENIENLKHVPGTCLPRKEQVVALHCRGENCLNGKTVLKLVQSHLVL